MNREEYLHAVLQLIRSSDRVASTGLKASTLGNLILRSLPQRWSHHGFLGLKELLYELRDRGVVTVGPDAQNTLAVWITDTSHDAPRASTAKFFRLRREIWAAFINITPPGLRFMQRTTGAVIMGQTRPPIGENGWIPIPTITEETQKGWAREFIGQLDCDEVRETLGAPLWYLRLPERLRQLRPDALVQWNRLRSTRVTEAVAAWCAENGIDTELVVDSRARSPASSEKSATAAPTVEPRDTIRQQILSALARMSTDELLEIPIPAKYIFGRAPEQT